MALWIADGTAGLKKADGQALTPPCYALCCLENRVFAACERQGFCLQKEKGNILFDFSLPSGVCALAPFGPYLCALSRDADCLWALSPQTGTLCLTAPAGSYPRDFSISPCGCYAAVAVSGAGKVLILDRELRCIRRERVAGAPVGVCFHNRRLLVLCAVGDYEISARLVSISPRGVTEEVFLFPQPPACLCPLRDGGCLMGCHGTVVQLSAAGQVKQLLPCCLPSRIRPGQNSLLIADGQKGTVFDLQRHILCRSAEPLDFCVV